MPEDEPETILPEDVQAQEETPPVLPSGLPQEEQYFLLLAEALRKCLMYKPKFGQNDAAGLSAQQFAVLYGADPFYSWLGVDSPLMYAAHKAAGGMTSVYRQIGIGSQWVFSKVLQDHLALTAGQAAWGYAVTDDKGKTRRLSLDGRIDLADVADTGARERVGNWVRECAAMLGLPAETLANIKGAVFEARQGYKSKDSKRQNVDLVNASQAYAHFYLPVVLLFSTQMDGDIARRYRNALLLTLTGTTHGPATASTYSFCRDVVGYDLADFFLRYSPRLKAEVEAVLTALLTP